jgi:hypothetical protein
MPNQALPEMSASEQLELKALKDRVELHRSLSQLRSQIQAAKEEFRPLNYLRAHRTKAVVMAALVGTLSGFGFAGMLTRH